MKVPRILGLVCFLGAGVVPLTGVLDRVPGCFFLAGVLGLRASSSYFSSKEGFPGFFGVLDVLPGCLTCHLVPPIPSTCRLVL